MKMTDILSASPANSAQHRQVFSRRRLLTQASQAIAVMAISPYLQASPQSQRQAMQQTFGESKINNGRVNLQIPALAENGNSVRLQASVDSPMTADDYVESLHLFSEANPIPTMASYYFSPQSGKAAISTRVRLNDTQTITAIAKMSDASLWAGSADVTVTIAACANPWL